MVARRKLRPADERVATKITENDKGYSKVYVEKLQPSEKGSNRKGKSERVSTRKEPSYGDTSNTLKSGQDMRRSRSRFRSEPKPRHRLSSSPRRLPKHKESFRQASPMRRRRSRSRTLSPGPGPRKSASRVRTSDRRQSPTENPIASKNTTTSKMAVSPKKQNKLGRQQKLVLRAEEALDDPSDEPIEVVAIRTIEGHLKICILTSKGVTAKEVSKTLMDTKLKSGKPALKNESKKNPAPAHGNVKLLQIRKSAVQSKPKDSTIQCPVKNRRSPSFYKRNFDMCFSEDSNSIVNSMATIDKDEHRGSLSSFRDLCSEKRESSNENIRMEIMGQQDENNALENTLAIEEKPWQEIVQATETLNTGFIDITEGGVGFHNIPKEAVGDIKSALAKIKHYAERFQVDEKELVAAVRDDDETSVANPVFAANEPGAGDSWMDLVGFYFKEGGSILGAYNLAPVTEEDENTTLGSF